VRLVVGGDGKCNGSKGIWESGDYCGLSRDGGGNGGVGAEANSAMRAFIDAVIAIMSSSIITYTFVYTDSEPWRFQWVSDDELEAPDATPQSPGQTPLSLDDVLGPKHPPSLDYVPE
nr:hypothetical protein [Tanacetum cinerariifolium]